MILIENIRISENLRNLAGNILLLYRQLSNDIRNLNLFPSIPPSTDDFDLQNERISTRLFLLLMFISAATLITHTTVVKVASTSNIDISNFKEYSKLYLIRSQDLTCPCTTISIDYQVFLQIEYVYHQICHSTFVTDAWINHVSSSFEDHVYDPPSFLWTGTNVFQALKVFCELSNKTISDSLHRFYTNHYITSTAVPEHLFEYEMQSIIEQFMSSTKSHFLLSLQTIRNTNQANALLSAKETNMLLYFLRNDPIAYATTLSYDDCDCGNSATCFQSAAIYNYSDLTMLFSIPGQYVGCFPLESILQSNLECFFDQTCLNRLQYYILSNVTINTTVLDSSLPSRFAENSTVQELVNELMIERWNRTMTYENYYNACQPKICTFSHASRNDIIYMITTLPSLIGGISKILALALPLCVKLIRKKRRFINREPEINAQPQRSLFSRVKQNLLELNMFPSMPLPVNEIDLKNQRISTRLFIVTFAILASILLGYLSLVRFTKIVNVNAPNFNKYSLLYSAQSKTLSCPCETISIDYKEFLRVNYKYHQVCHSVFVTNDWIDYIDARYGREVIGTDDFRWSGANAFRALKSLCELTNQTIFQSLTQLYSYQYISNTVTPPNLFQRQIEASFQEFVSLTSNKITSSLQIIRDTTQANSLWGIAGSQYRLHRHPQSEALSLRVSSYLNCNCDDSAKCIRQSSIYVYTNKTVLLLIPGFYLGCFVIEALLQSTLECFYHQACIRSIQSYIKHVPFKNITALDSQLPSHFSQYSTLQEIINKSMVEEWNQSIVYENYYNLCAPITCTYSYSSGNDITYIVMTLLGLTGGLVTLLKFFIPRLVRFIRRNRRLETPQPATNCCNRLFNQCLQFCLNFNLFSSTPPSDILFNIRIELISTRLFLLLLCLATITLITYTSLIRIVTVNVDVVDMKTHSDLYSKHSQALVCPCTKISMDYEKFLSIEYKFHQVCSSIFVTDYWKHSLLLRPNSTIYLRDFRGTRKHMFQALRLFCDMTNATISESLKQLYSTQYISAVVIPWNVFQLEIQSVFEQFVSLARNKLLLSLEIIRDTTQVNALFSGRWSNYDLYSTSSPRVPNWDIIAPRPRYYSNCRCDVSVSCFEQAAIYDEAEKDIVFSVPGMYSGCFIIESLLQSALTCFYDQTCLNRLQSYLDFHASINITALSPASLNRFSINSTVREIMNELFVETWNLSTSYEDYYNECQPAQCFYSQVKRNDIIYTVTTVFGLIGGIATILKHLIFIVVKLAASYCRNRQTITPE